MQIRSNFSVPLSPEETWNSLLDFQRVAAAMPGARLDEVKGEEVKGSVTVKLGPMRVEYRGTARVDASDPDRRELRMVASGDETRGTGSAKADIVAQLSPLEQGTTVDIVADLDITGRPAQMGAGLIQDVAKRLTDEFAERLRQDLMTASPEPEAPSPVSHAQRAELDLFRVAGGPIGRRVGLAAIVVGVLWLVRRILR